MNELKSMLVAVAKQQKEAIEAGVSPKAIAEQRLIEGESTRVP